MTLAWVLSQASFLLLLVNVVFLVDRNNFKTCDQSSFCKRHRGYSPDEAAQFKVSGVKSLTRDTVSLEVSSTENSSPLILEISVYTGPVFRIKINEINPLYPRFEVPYVIEKLPQQHGFKVEEESTEKIVLVYSETYKIVVVRSPFSIHIFDKGDLVLQFNRDNMLKFEEYRKKPDAIEVADSSNDEDNEDEEEASSNEDPPLAKIPKEDAPAKHQEGMWEETFKSHHDSKPRGPASVGVDIAFPGFRHIYGIPEHADTFNLHTTKNNGDPYRLYNLDVFEYELDSRMALYGAIPFVVAHNPRGSIGMLWLNAAETWVDVDRPEESKPLLQKLTSFLKSTASKESVSTQWISESGVIDVYITMGPTTKDVLRQYASLTGLAPLPPQFAIAYHQCRWNYNDEEDCRAVDEGFDTHDIPYDVLWLDIEHTDDKKYFTWDARKFPNAKGMIDDLNAKGRKMVTIIDPHIKRTSGYRVHDEGTRLGYYVKKADAKTDYNGHCWPGDSSWVDYLRSDARSWWSSLFSFDAYPGSTPALFTWNDMNEPSVFSGPEITMHKDALHGEGHTVEHRDLHNMYGMLMVMATHQGQLQRSHNQIRPFILSRAFFAGSQRLGAIWTGDNMASWDHMRASIPMLLSLNIAGYSFVGADVGGFFKDPRPELLVRWYQLGSFTPFFRAHAHIETKRREPWLFGDENTMLIRDAVRRRYALLPYWYTQFFKSSVAGLAVMRPYFLEFPQETQHYEKEDAFMVGPSLLVAPVLHESATSVTISLPGESSLPWYGWEDGKIQKGGSVLTESVTMSTVPIFVRGGSIIAQKGRVRRSSVLARNDPLTLLIAPDAKGVAYGDLYLDDDHTFNYKKGEFIYRQFEYASGVVTSSDCTAIREAGDIPVHGSRNYDTKVWLEKVIIYGVEKKATSANLSHGGKETKLDVIYDAASKKAVIRKPGINIKDNFTIKLVF